MTDDDMKSEYDFSGGKRGQFFKPNLKLNLPVYLDSEVVSYLRDRQEEGQAALRCRKRAAEERD